jgi:hypothetical protein
MAQYYADSSWLYSEVYQCLQTAIDIFDQKQQEVTVFTAVTAQH